MQSEKELYSENTNNQTHNIPGGSSEKVIKDLETIVGFIDKFEIPVRIPDY